MSATNSPRSANRPTRTTRPDPNAIDLAWAMGRARNWLLGPAPLAVNLSLFLFVGLGTLLWRLSQQPDGFRLPGWLLIWGVLVALHAGVVVAWGAIHAVRTPHRGPVYYQDIPQEQRTVSRASARGAQTPARSAPVEVARPTWRGVLAPVTPFPMRNGSARFGTNLRAAPDQDDMVISGHPGPGDEGNDAFGSEHPAMGQRGSALADVRSVLADEQPFWRRWRRRPAKQMALAELPVDEGSSWLSPFPGARPVTRPAPPTPPTLGHDGIADPDSRPAVDRRWPAPVPTGPPVGRAGRTADSEQIPSLAAMLRSSNLTSLSDAPIVTRPSETAPSDRVPGALPSAPIPFSRPPAPSGAQPGTSALFAAFGIDGDGDGKTTRQPAHDSTPETREAVKTATPSHSARSGGPAPRRPDRS